MPSGNPWLDFAGRSADDPDWDDYLAEIARYRAAADAATPMIRFLLDTDHITPAGAGAPTGARTPAPGAARHLAVSIVTVEESFAAGWRCSPGRCHATSGGGLSELPRDRRFFEAVAIVPFDLACERARRCGHRSGSASICASPPPPCYMTAPSLRAISRTSAGARPAHRGLVSRVDAGGLTE